MTIQQMNYFIETCRCGSIARAADALFISPSGLRLALHRTEKELGCKLLDWGARGIRPTGEGEFFLCRAEEICRLYGECEERFGIQTAEPNTVEVAVGDRFPNLFVTSLLAAFNRSENRYQALYKDFFDVQDAVCNGPAEIGFDSGPVDRKTFICTPVVRYPIYAVVNEAGPFGKYEVLPPQCLDGTEIILNDKHSKNTEFFEACRHYGVKPVTTDTVGRELTVFFGVQVAPRRVGITNVECAETVSIPGLQVIPIDGPEFFEQIYMFRKRGDYLTPAGEQLERFVKSELEKCPEDPD